MSSADGSDATLLEDGFTTGVGAGVVEEVGAGRFGVTFVPLSACALGLRGGIAKRQVNVTIS